MKILKRILLSIFIIAFIIGLYFGYNHFAKDDYKINFNVSNKSKYSIFIYVCGSNLESTDGAATKNISEMLQANVSNDVNVIIETGGANMWHTQGINEDKNTRWLLKNKSLKKLSEEDKKNMGESSTLSSFLTYGINNYPAEKYGLILWNHGNACNGVCNDENYFYDSLKLYELDEALKVLGDNKLDFIGFDACLMSNFETLNTLKKYSHYMMASEEIEPSGGWDYNEVLSSICMNDEMTTEDLGKIVCDSYFAKSKASKRSDIATMNLINLDEFDNLKFQFDNICDNLKLMAKEPQSLQKIAYGTKNSIKFGGSTQSEGYSNLVDLKTFINGIDELDGKKEFNDAFNKVLIYNKAGNKKESAGGISIYYPVNFDEYNLKDYLDICPFEKYKEYLKQTFTNIPSKTIVFDNDGSIASDDSFEIQINKESLPYILSVDFALLEYNVDDSAYTLTETALGYDNDIIYEEDENKNITGKYNSNFRGIWCSLNGYKLYYEVVEGNRDYILFNAPIVLNGKSSNLKFAFNYDYSLPTHGTYEMIGAWNGLDSETQMSDKNIYKLTKDDVVETLYPSRTIRLGSNGKVVKSDVTYNSLKVDTKDKEYEITEDGFDGECYAYQFIVTDIYGKKYYSKAALMEMTETREQINEHERLNFEFAGKAIEVIETNGKYILDDELIQDEQTFIDAINFIRQIRKHNKENIAKNEFVVF
ncbi:MAG: clostripain-related cysteine peptidase [Clostridia bacterium]|nr:clostripain-related cysteine peptidase [Clostridia bacterium]